MNRTSTLLNDELLESEQCLADVLKRFAEKEKQRRARHIVQRRARQLNEVREDVLRRRAEKGQPMDCIEEQAHVAGIKDRDDWECKNDEQLVAAIALGLGGACCSVKKQESNDKGEIDKTTDKANDKHSEQKKHKTCVVTQLLGKTTRRRAQREDSLKRRGQGTTSIPRDFSPLADISEMDLGRVYAEPNYCTRFRLYKEAARKACGLKVWTWEELTDGMNRTLCETCRMPMSRIGKPVASRSANLERADHVTSAERTDSAGDCKRGRSGATTDGRYSFKVPKSFSRELIRSIKQEIQDEKKEQELKFLELEMKMTPYVVDAGLFDSDPEFTEELNDSITEAHAKQKIFQEMNEPSKPVGRRTRRKGLQGEGNAKRHRGITTTWSHIPTATAKRAKEHKEAIARRRARSEALDYDPYEEDGMFKGIDSMLSYDPTTKKFMAPQATLLRAKEREREGIDRALWRQRIREKRHAKRLARARSRHAAATPTRPPGRRGSRRSREPISPENTTCSDAATLIQREKGDVTSSEETLSTLSLPIRGIIRSRASGSSSTHSFRRKPGYYLGDNISSSSSNHSLSSAWRRTRSPSIDSSIKCPPGLPPTPCTHNTTDTESHRKTADRQTVLSAAKNVLAGDTDSQETSAAEENSTGEVFTPKQWSSCSSYLSPDGDIARVSSPIRSVRQRSNDSRKGVELPQVMP